MKLRTTPNRTKIAFSVNRPERCVYTEYDEIFRTYNDVGYETVRGYDVKPRHYPRHSRIQSLGALQNNR